MVAYLSRLYNKDTKKSAHIQVFFLICADSIRPISLWRLFQCPRCKSVDFLESSPVDNIYYLGKKGFEWITTPSKNLRRSRVNQDIIGCQTANQQDNWIGDFRVEHPQPYHYQDKRIYIGRFDFGDGKGNVDAVGRKMTPRECMNLMGFDGTFKIVVKDSIAYRHAGNSIVVPVLKEIIETLKKYL